MIIRRCIPLLLALTLSLSALLIPSAIDTSFSQKAVTFTKEDCGCSFPGMDLVDTKLNSTVYYNWLECQYGSMEGSGKNWVKVSVAYYNDASKASAEYQTSKKVFADSARWAKEGRTEGVEPAQFITEVNGADRYGYVEYYHKANPPFYWGEMVILRNSNFMAYVHLSGPQMDDSEAISVLYAAAKCADDIIDKKTGEKLSLNLVHYHPFDESVQSKSAAHKAGDLVATVKDKSGKPMAGEKVYFFVNKELSDQGFSDVFEFTQRGADFAAAGQYSALSFNYEAVVTDQNGQATCNYIALKALKPYELGQRLTAQKGDPVVGIVTAAVFKEDPQAHWTNLSVPEPRTKALANVELEFKGMARITNIITRDIREKPVGSVVVRRGGMLITVTMKEVGGATLESRNLPGGWGFPLNLNDTIRIGANDEVTIQWLSGARMGFQPKSDFDWYGHEYVEVWIGAIDSGWYNYLNALNYFWINQVITVLSSGVTVWSIWSAATALTVADVALAIPGVVALVWNLGDRYTNPLIVELKSQVLFDLEESATVYTLEGTATLRNVNDKSKVDVTTGHKMTVSADGKFGAVSEFTEAQLDADLAQSAQSMREEQSSTNAQNPGLGFDQQPFPDLESDDNSNLIWVIGPAIAAMFVLGMAAILLRKKRRQAAPAYSQPSIPVSPGPKAETPPKVEGRFCSKCGTPASVDDTYCGNCGSGLPKVASAAAKAEPPPVSCPSCGTQAQPEKKFCGKCGAALSSQGQMSAAQVYCSKCGSPNAGGSLFCRKCGSKIAP